MRVPSVLASSRDHDKEYTERLCEGPLSTSAASLWEWGAWEWKVHSKVKFGKRSVQVYVDFPAVNNVCVIFVILSYLHYFEPRPLQVPSLDDSNRVDVFEIS